MVINVPSHVSSIQFIPVIELLWTHAHLNILTSVKWRLCFILYEEMYFMLSTFSTFKTKCQNKSKAHFKIYHIYQTYGILKDFMIIMYDPCSLVTCKLSETEGTNACPWSGALEGVLLYRGPLRCSVSLKLLPLRMNLNFLYLGENGPLQDCFLQTV